MLFWLAGRLEPCRTRLRMAGLLAPSHGWYPLTAWVQGPSRARAWVLLSILLQDKIHEYTVYMSYVQLYMELIQVGVGWFGGGGCLPSCDPAACCCPSPCR